MKKIKRLLQSRKSLVSKCDALFSLYIRLKSKRENNGACAFGCGRAECCFHFVSRAKHSLRWDEKNAVASCHGANYRYEFDPHFAIQWYIKKFGQKGYDDLIFRGSQQAKFSRSDLMDIRDSLNIKLVLVMDPVIGQ